MLSQKERTGRWRRWQKQERNWRRWPRTFLRIRPLNSAACIARASVLKRIRYLAELADESAEQKDFIRELKSVQDAVGDWHDWQELTNTAEKRFSDRVNCAILREVRALLAARHATATSSSITCSLWSWHLTKNLLVLPNLPGLLPNTPDRTCRSLPQSISAPTQSG